MDEETGLVDAIKDMTSADQRHHNSMGKFSVYFVVLSTAIVILLFILALYRLIRHC